jgi:CRP/FNR family cyclic AMP-dependent transcriptional regulator
MPSSRWSTSSDRASNATRMPPDDQLFQRFGREFPKGHVLFCEGEPGLEMYVVQSGRVNIIKKVRETEKVLATLGPGEFLGEMSLLNKKPRSAGAVMAEDGKLLVIDPKTFEAMIRGNAEIAVRLISKLADRLQDADDQIENLLHRDPISRVVHFLIQAAQRKGKETAAGVLVPGNLAELYLRMGLLPDEVQEAITQVHKAKIVLLTPEGAVIPDLGKALKYLDFLEMKTRFGES